MLIQTNNHSMIVYICSNKLVLTDLSECGSKSEKENESLSPVESERRRPHRPQQKEKKKRRRRKERKRDDIGGSFSSASVFSVACD